MDPNFSQNIDGLQQQLEPQPQAGFMSIKFPATEPYHFRNFHRNQFGDVFAVKLIHRLKPQSEINKRFDF